MLLKDLDIKGYETLFIDRDGVINKHRPNDYVKSWEEFEFLPGVFEAFEYWASQFKYIIIVTNQRGIGRGLMSEADLFVIHNRMKDEIERNRGRIDKIYFCTAMDNADPDRKPNPGMGLKALNDFPDIDLKKAIMIGDSESDMLFANKLGVRGVLYQLDETISKSVSDK